MSNTETISDTGPGRSYGARSLKIGRLFGVDLRVDPSWIFIFMLLCWNLTAAFSVWHPYWTGGLSFVVAVIASLLFFASVVLHEIAHAVVAQSFGLRVKDITLFLFGGVSNIESEPPSPRAEFLTAIVGPLVSIGLGLVLLLLATLVTSMPTDPDEAIDAISQLGPSATILMWLGPINILIGVFNLIPGFPLDGGRILRAALWKATGDIQKGTRWAATVGQGIGWLFIVMGLAMVFGARIPFFGRGVVGGIWLAFIGWFLTTAAERSYRGLLVRDALSGLTVTRVMRRSGPVIPAQTSVHSVVSDWFMRSDERAFPVVDGERFVGIVCLEDVRRVPQEDWATLPVSDIMTPAERLAVASPSEDLASAMQKLAERNVSQLPVLEDGKLLGMLERRDIARFLEIRIASHTTTRRAHA